MNPCARLRWTTGDAAVTQAELAVTPFARLRGLLGRTGLSPGTGLLITPCSAVHTAFMRFPIDVVFLDRMQRVVGLREALPPWRIAGCRHAAKVLELPAGEARRLRLGLGDRCETAP